MFTFDTFQTFGRDGFEAGVKSFGAIAGGFQTAASETADYAKRSFEQGTQAAERLMGVRSVDTAVQVQTEYAKASYEAFVAQTSRMRDLATTVGKDAYAPIEGLFAKSAPTA